MYLVKLIWYKCHKINFKRGKWYIESPEWIKNKEAIINPKSYKCLQYVVTKGKKLFKTFKTKKLSSTQFK